MNEKSLDTKTLLVSEHARAFGRDLMLAVCKQIVEIGHHSRIRLYQGALMGMAETVTIFCFRWIDLCSDDPNWPERDRFVLSTGQAHP